MKDGRGGYAVLRSEHHFSCCELFSMSLSLLFRTNSRDTLPTHTIVNQLSRCPARARVFRRKRNILFFENLCLALLLVDCAPTCEWLAAPTDEGDASDHSEKAKNAKR